MSLLGAWALLLGASPALAASAPVRPDNTWVRLAPLPEKLDSPVFAMAVSPSDPALLMVGTGSGTIYRSNDGGSTWTAAAHGLGRGVTTIQYSPFKAGLIYAGTRAGGLWRSTDSGATWAKLAGIPNTTVRSLGFAKSMTLAGADGGLYSTHDGTTWAPYLSFSPLSLDAIAVPAVNDPPHLLAGGDASKGSEPLPLYFSSDGGTSWTSVKSLGSSTMIGAAAAGPVLPKGDNRQLVVGTNVGAFLSNDGGVTWGQIAGLPAIDFTAVAYVANHADRFYVASDGGATLSGGLWASSDSGQTFRSLQAPIASVTALAISSEDAPTVYSASFRPLDQVTLLWSYRDTGGTPNPPSSAIPAVAGVAAPATSSAPAPAAYDWRRSVTGPEAPYLALGVLAVLVMLTALGLQIRRGRE
ncbi:MAG: hypothetical protein E6J29_03485 [Chloroflexi bacterium]|nr:MAG: hypothetical protein E6J29_03485 [Chloroflexota bacterium]